MYPDSMCIKVWCCVPWLYRFQLAEQQRCWMFHAEVRQQEVVVLYTVFVYWDNIGKTDKAGPFYLHSITFIW